MRGKVKPMSEDEEEEFFDAVDRGFEAMSAPMVGVELDVVLAAAETMLTFVLVECIKKGTGETRETLRSSLHRVHSNVMNRLGPLYAEMPASDAVH
jgi:hypothetical protein